MRRCQHLGQRIFLLLGADREIYRRAIAPCRAPLAHRAFGIELGRFGKAEEFANMACFLASDAGSYVTGTAINIDGGRSPVV